MNPLENKKPIVTSPAENKPAESQPIAQKLYVTINGDSTANGIGQSIANNDDAGFEKQSSNIKNSHQAIDQWVASIGGKVIASTGDEGTYIIPADKAAELENVRKQYEQTSGNTLTIGVGSTMSEAFKALIYGKMSGKNRISQYDPKIEESLSNHTEASDDTNENTEEVAQDPSQNVEPNLADKQTTPIQQSPVDPTQADPTKQVQPATTNPAQAVQKEPAQQAALSAEPTDKQPKNVSQSKALQQEKPKDQIEGGLADKKNPADFDQQQLAAGTKVEMEHTKDQAKAQEIAMDHLTEDPKYYTRLSEMESASPTKIDNQSDEGDTEGDTEDDAEDQDGGMLSNMIYEDMNEAEPSAEGDMADPGQNVDSNIEDPNSEMDMGSDEAMKADITRSLEIFKNHQEILEQAKNTNPELYTALITMLRVMINMGKKMFGEIEETEEVEENIEETGEPMEEVGETEDGDEGEEEAEEEAEENKKTEPKSDKKQPIAAKKEDTVKKK